MTDEDKPPEEPKKKGKPGPKEERLVIEGDPEENLQKLFAPGPSRRDAAMAKSLRKQAEGIREWARSLEEEFAAGRAAKEHARADVLEQRAEELERRVK